MDKIFKYEINDFRTNVLKALEEGITNNRLKMIKESKLNPECKYLCMSHNKCFSDEALSEILESDLNDRRLKEIILAVNMGLKESHLKTLLKKSVGEMYTLLDAYKMGMDEENFEKILEMNESCKISYFTWYWKHKRLKKYKNIIDGWADFRAVQLIGDVSLTDIDDKNLETMVNLYKYPYDVPRMYAYKDIYNQSHMTEEHLNVLAQLKDDPSMRFYSLAIKNKMDDKNLERFLSLAGRVNGSDCVRYYNAWENKMDDKNLEILSNLKSFLEMSVYVEAYMQNAEQECLDVLAELNNYEIMYTCVNDYEIVKLDKGDLIELKRLIQTNSFKNFENDIYSYIKECIKKKTINDINQYIKDNNLDIDINIFKELIIQEMGDKNE